MIKKFFQRFFFILSIIGIFSYGVEAVDAATLHVGPNTGVYTVNKAFTVSVILNTEGKAVNAADGQLSFNPKELVPMRQIAPSTSFRSKRGSNSFQAGIVRPGASFV